MMMVVRTALQVGQPGRLCGVDRGIALASPRASEAHLRVLASDKSQGRPEIDWLSIAVRESRRKQGQCRFANDLL